MVTTLTGLDKGNENEIDIYTDTALQPTHDTPKDGLQHTNQRRRRDIVLRNMMLDMLLSLLSSSHMELNTRLKNLVLCMCLCVKSQLKLVVVKLMQS